MSHEDLRHALVDVKQSVAYARKEAAGQLQELVAKADGQRCPVPVDLLDLINEFRPFDPASLRYDFGEYVYSLLTQDPTRFSDQFMGYEWNASDLNPVVDILIRPVAVPA